MNRNHKNHAALKTHIIDPRLSRNNLRAANDHQEIVFIEQDASEIEVPEISVEQVSQAGIYLLNNEERTTPIEAFGLFQEILKYGLPKVHTFIGVNSNTSYDGIESACFLDNAWAYLENNKENNNPEIKLIQIWHQVFTECLGLSEDRSFEFMARMMKRLFARKKAA